jgi:hypothetical protein
VNPPIACSPCWDKTLAIAPGSRGKNRTLITSLNLAGLTQDIWVVVMVGFIAVGVWLAQGLLGVRR